MRIEDYGLIGDLQTAALVGAERARSTGSASRASTRAPASPRCSATMSTAAGCSRRTARSTRVERRYRPSTLVHELDFRDRATAACASSTSCRPRGDDPDLVRIVEGLEGRCRCATELVLRFDYGSHRPVGAPARGRHADRDRRPGRGARSTRRSTLRGENLTHRRPTFTVEAGERVPFVLTWFPSHLDPPRADRRPTHALEETCDVLARVARPLHATAATGPSRSAAR